jgi:putative ATP-dependent endonuclease of the OLD family
MRIGRIQLRGFRNFKDATIDFAEKTLLIGANDIGKSNLLFALRILLDRSLPDTELEPKDSDFYAYEETNEFEIIVEFIEVVEECIIAKMREHVSDEGHMILAYRASRNAKSRKSQYKIFAGRDVDFLAEIQSRFYLRVLNLKFIAGRRDLFDYIRRERKALLQEAKDDRAQEEIDKDTVALDEIGDALDGINKSVRKLSYVNKATIGVNRELNDLSFYNNEHEVVLDAASSDPSSFVDDLKLASRVQGKSVIIGGEGRNNQIHIALWAARNRMLVEDGGEPTEVRLFCIEEPEAHLHPHQQRKLAQYLVDTLKGQVIITSHSPQIACQIPPESIVRLCNLGNGTFAACNGVNTFIETAFVQFGYRLSIIPAEAFFSNAVLLVEGISEELFYKGLAKELGIDLDRLNISVLMVDGIGFKPYVSLLNSLGIPFVMRTDNDVFKVPKQPTYRYAGIQRAIDIYRLIDGKNENLEKALSTIESKLQGFSVNPPPVENEEAARQICHALEEFNVFLSDKDLEQDMYAAFPAEISEYVGLEQPEDVIEEMQKRKGTFMFEFLREHVDILSRLAKHSLATPLLRCKQIVEDLYGPHTN